MFPGKIYHSPYFALQSFSDSQYLAPLAVVVVLGTIIGIVFFLKRRNQIAAQIQNRERLIAEAGSGKDKELAPLAKSHLQAIPETTFLEDLPLVEAVARIYLKASPQDASALISRAIKKYPQQAQFHDFEIDALVAKRATDNASLEKIWAAFQRKPDRKDWLARYASAAMAASSPTVTGLKSIGEHFRQSGDAKSLLFLSDTYEKKKIFNEVSLPFFQEIHRTDSRNLRWYYAIARCQQNLGKFEDALQKLEESLIIDPTFQPALELKKILQDNQEPEQFPEEPQPTSADSTPATQAGSDPLGGEDGSIKLPDRYIEISELGRGGMGIVFKAFDDVLKRWVAIKVLQEQTGPTQPETRERFLTESRVMAGLDHPVIPKVFDVSVNPPCYIALEFLEGVDMRGYLSTHENISLKNLVGFGIDLADGFHHAGERGVLHRDIKPENIMVENTGRCRILDFGLARTEKHKSTVTQEGFVVGTPWYMAPERLKGEPATIFSEIYAFGVTFYEILTGQRPFDGDDFSVILFKEPKLLRELRPECPQSLEVLILDCLSKNPANRPRSFAEIRDELKELGKKLPEKN